MRISRAIFSILIATAIFGSTVAQIRIIPREKRDSVANPANLNSREMVFAEGRHLDFGTMAEDGGVVTKRVAWQNCGNEPMVITRITTSCGCVVCDYERKPVENGAHSEISISYNPAKHPGVMRHRVFVYTNRSAEVPTTIIDIEGRVTASANRRGDYPHAVGSLLLRNREIRFDPTDERPQSIRIACMNAGKSVLTPRKDPLLSSEELSLECRPESLQAGEEGFLVIRYTPSGKKQGARPILFIENRNIAPRDREIKIITDAR